MTKKLLLLTAAALFFFGCGKSAEEKKEAEQLAAAGIKKVVVKEVTQVSQYTYLHVDEDGKDYWMAATKREAKEGQTLYYRNAMEMKNFKSPELNKTFETILFVQELSDQSPLAAQKQPQADMGTRPVKPEIEKQNVRIDRIAGGTTIEELFSNPKKYDGKEILIKGQVLKVNNGIMDRNWVHIQDGTASGGKYDLTVTTDEVFTEGAVITVKGKIALDKDFGYGYSYAVLLENAKSVKGS